MAKQPSSQSAHMKTVKR